MASQTATELAELAERVQYLETALADVVFAKLLRPTAKLPTNGSGLAAGLDLYADITESVMLWGGKTLVVPTGVAIELPENFVGLVCPRSGLAVKHQITILNSPGVIDPDYRGEIYAVLHSLAPYDKAYTIEPGERVAQLVVVPCWMGSLVSAERLSPTARGSNGFGSTGR